MPQEPCIKGSTIADLFEDLKKLIDAGEISQADVDRHLHEEDRKLLDGPIATGSWYSVQSQARALELMRDTVGGGHNRLLVERGKRKGEKLMEAGLYQQMEYAGRAEVMSAKSPEERYAAFGRDLKLLITLSGSILNFSRWTVVPDPDRAGRYLLEITEAEAYPEALIHSTEGLIDSLATAMGHPGLWTWERIASDHIRFWMTRAI
jgi:hypothetical protein